MSITKESFKKIKELEFIEELADYRFKDNVIAITLPDIDELTSFGYKKSDEVIKSEREAAYKKPFMVVGFNRNGETDNMELKIESNVYIKPTSSFLDVRRLKNSLNENFIVVFVYINDIVLIKNNG
jgi:hypothetical protein